MNLNKPTKLIGIELIQKHIDGNISNTHPDDIEIVYVNYLDEGLLNTEVKLDINRIRSVRNQTQAQYQLTVRYDRINIKKITKDREVHLPYNKERLLSDYLVDINDIFNINLTKNDIVDGVIPSNYPRPYRLVIKISEDNLAFFGDIILYIEDTPLTLVKSVYNDIKSMMPNLSLTGITPGVNI